MTNPYNIVNEFEKAIAEWAGSQFAVAVESGSAALFLSCSYRYLGEVSIPKFTYPSVPAGIIHAGGTVKFTNEKWSGIYELKPYEIYDSALRFRKGMYKNGLHCLSFHMKKHLPIARGGMILTDSYTDYKMLKLLRFDGREEKSLEGEDIKVVG